MTQNSTKQAQVVNSIGDGLAPAERKDMKGLLDKMSSQMEVMSQKGETRTTLTLKNMPVFEGASISVHAYDNARGEFNVSFANLSNEAKLLLDNAGRQDALKQALDNKGYVVHMISTSVEKESLVTMTHAENSDNEQEDEAEERPQDEPDEENTEQKDDK